MRTISSACERCGLSPRLAGNSPWCAGCRALLTGDVSLRAEYHRDYHRAYARGRRISMATARPKWIVTSESRRFEVTLRRRDGRVIVCGGFQGTDAARRLVSGVFGACLDDATEQASGGGSGSGTRKQSRIRITALVEPGEFLHVMAALERGGSATRVGAFSSGSGSRMRRVPTSSPGA